MDNWEPSEESSLQKHTLDCTDRRIQELVKSQDLDLEFYEAESDINNEVWATKKFGKVKGQVLSCPGCFSIVSTQSQLHSGNFLTKNLHNCTIEAPLEDSSGSIYLRIDCSHCKAELGVHDPQSNTSHLFNVLSSFGYTDLLKNARTQ